MIVIGSVAYRYHRPEISSPADLDLVGTYDEAKAFVKAFKPLTYYPINEGKTMYMRFKHGDIVEFEIAWPDSRAEGFLEFAKQHPEHFNRVPMTIDGAVLAPLCPSLNVLYMLKMSHRYLKDSPHFLKTMRGIQEMRLLGCTIPDDVNPYYLKRMAETYSYAHPKLNVSKDGFFDPEGTGVEYTYDHDSIHEAVKIHYQPAYMFFKPKDSEVMCSKGMFFNEPRNIQLCAVVEESCVLALERSLIPYPNGMTPKAAFDMALMKVCTSITSGWFREFAWENYDSAQNLYSAFEDQYGSEWFVKKFNAGLESGIIKPFNGKGY
jgi:hypothetical protein